jgi:hypothetical protein
MVMPATRAERLFSRELILPASAWAALGVSEADRGLSSRGSWPECSPRSWSRVTENEDAVIVKLL